MKQAHLAIKYPAPNPGEDVGTKKEKQRLSLLSQIQAGLELNDVVLVNNEDLLPFRMNTNIVATNEMTKYFYANHIVAKQGRMQFVFSKFPDARER